MTDERDSKDEIEGVPSGDDGLWADVQFWVNAILSVFGDLKEVAHVGLTRSLGVKLCNWLWGVEGAIRRLIIAEALRLDPAALKEARPRTEPARRERAPGKHRPCFRIFAFSRQDEAMAPGPSAGGTATTGLPAWWHIRFPSDPLLSIGARPVRKGRASVRRLNPLDRRGRISSLDPDYGLDREEDVEALLLGLSSSRPARPSRPRPEPVLAQDKPYYLAPRSDPFDWKRVEEEWKRQIPAPHLATRVFAVAGIMERREQAIHRIARILQRRRERVVQMLAQPLPQLLWPRHARLIYRCREVEDLVPRCHARLWRLDTS
jgi:hypothetical protein